MASTTKHIDTIFFDLGGTFRIVNELPEYYQAARRKIAQLVGTDIDPEEFYDLIMQRYDIYREWVFATNREAYEDYLWIRWLTPEYDHERLREHASELTYLLRQAKGRREVVEGGVELIKELRDRGYKLGIISNLIGVKEIDEWLDADDLRQYFCAVQQSSISGIRKPDPIIFWAAAGQASSIPANCAYIGDNFKTDVGGARSAGYGAVIICATAEEVKEKGIPAGYEPDIVINDIKQLLDVFPKAPVFEIA
ncbi:MAG: HAD family hydrolase [Lachnospiraceae bacterium]|jgi:HAD superfamily hydrolase (TIGR01549 family)|nr:HAD family hydrolase [Lachnospiraceae bacterium]